MLPIQCIFLLVIVISVGDNGQGSSTDSIFSSENLANPNEMLCYCDNKTLCPNESWPYCVRKDDQACSVMTEFTIDNKGMVLKKLTRQCVDSEKQSMVIEFYNNVTVVNMLCDVKSISGNSKQTVACNQFLQFPCQPMILSSKPKFDPSLSRQCWCSKGTENCLDGICKTDGYCSELVMLGKEVHASCNSKNAERLAFVKATRWETTLFNKGVYSCTIGSFCNRDSIDRGMSVVCPTANVYQWPTLEKPLSPTTLRPKSCLCTEGDNCTNGICEFGTSIEHVVCYTKIIRFLFSRTVSALSRGCSISERSDFKTRRVISLSKTEILTIYFECTDGDNCNKNLDPVECFLNEVKDNFPMQNLSKDDNFYCDCTEDGMQEEFKKACGSRMWCAKSVLLGKNSAINETSHFYCSNWGNKIIGCHFSNQNNPQSMGPFLLIDVLTTHKDGDESRHQFCRGSKCQQKLWINDIFNCLHETDWLMDVRSDPPEKDNGYFVKHGKINAANLLGTIFAVVVVFLTLFVGFCVSVNAVRICQIEWGDPDKKSQKKRRGGLMAYITV